MSVNLESFNIGQSRFHFGVLNLPLDYVLSCGPFTLTPIPAGQAELKKRGSMDYEPVLSVEGTAQLPEDIDLGDPWPYIFNQPLVPLELLLSFAERRFIEIVRLQVERWVDGKWQVNNRHAHYAQMGNPYGVSWHHGHAHLEEFMSRCLPIVADPERGEKSGLRLALQFYRTNFHNDFVELQYLKTWMALEILYSRYFESLLVLNDKDFRHVRRAIRECLAGCDEKGLLGEEQRSLMESKLGEINRIGARELVRRFFESVLKEHPVQEVTDADIRTFYRIRNDITHGGVMAHQGDDYGRILHHEHMRLKALLERVFLAMMGQDANLMTFSWTHCYAGR